MHRVELEFADGESFAEARDGLVCHVLLIVVHSHQEVRVARLQTFSVEELLDKLNILDVGLLALVLLAQSIVKCSN